MPVSSADIAGANAHTALRRIDDLEQRVTLLEKRLQTASDIIIGQNANVHRLISIVERLAEERERDKADARSSGGGRAGIDG